MSLLLSYKGWDTDNLLDFVSYIEPYFDDWGLAVEIATDVDYVMIDPPIQDEGEAIGLFFDLLYAWHDDDFTNYPKRDLEAERAIRNHGGHRFGDET